MKNSLIISLIITAVVFLLFSSVFFQLTSYLHPLVLAVVLCCIFFLFYALILYVRKETLKLPFRLLIGVLIIYTVALLVLLFFRPNNQSYHTYNLIPFSTISFYLSGKVNWLIAFYNLAANIGLFIPYGFYLMFISKKSLSTHVLLPLSCIVLIEVTQLLSHRGSLDIDDLLLNFLGIITGYIVYPVFRKIVIIEKGARRS